MAADATCDPSLASEQTISPSGPLGASSVRGRTGRPYRVGLAAGVVIAPIRPGGFYWPSEIGFACFLWLA
jgi:hypothetical protein